MEDFEIYLAKSMIILSTLYVLYWLLLRNENRYSWNRIFLLMTLLAAFLMPLLKFSLYISSGDLLPVMAPLIIKDSFLPEQIINTSESISILSIIYISGSVFFSLRFLSNLVRIHFLYFRHSKYSYNGFKAVILDKDQSPFTFFNILFISRHDFESGKQGEMLAHEKAHKEAFHSLDILLLEFMTIMQWFNPFIWLFRLSLKSEHEFIADKKVLTEGFDKIKYQKLLFEKSLGIAPFNLINSFNYSLLKKRLKMMTNNKSGTRVKIKYLVSMPLMLFTLLLLAFNLNTYGQKEKIHKEVNVMVQYKGKPISEVRHFIAGNLTYPESARTAGVSAKIFVQFVVDKKGEVKNVRAKRLDILEKSGKEVVIVGYSPEKNPEINPKAAKDLETEALRVMKLLEGFTPAQKDGENVATEYTFPVHFVLEKKSTKRRKKPKTVS